MSYMLRGVIAAAVMVAGVAQVYAAQVQPAGRVTVNGQTIAGTVTVSPGATVSVPGAGSATIYYENGCTEVVEAYNSRVVQSDPECRRAWYHSDHNKALIVSGLVVIGGVTAIIATNNNDDGPRRRPHSP